MEVPLRTAEESSFAEQINRWMDQVLGPDYRRRFAPRRAWAPSLNLYEDADNFYLVVELAGVEADKVDLRLEGRQLIVEGRRATPRPEESESGKELQPVRNLRMHVMEIDHGPFCRTLQLPQVVDRNRIEAAYRNGLLWVKMPKAGQP